jgi:hypothetical protein
MIFIFLYNLQKTEIKKLPPAFKKGRREFERFYSPMIFGHLPINAKAYSNKWKVFTNRFSKADYLPHYGSYNLSFSTIIAELTK